METQRNRGRYSPEVRARAMRMVVDHAGDCGSQWEAMCSIASKIGCAGESFRKWVRQAERDSGARHAMIVSHDVV